MIVNHVWRELPGRVPTADRPAGACAYWNCLRPRSEHERGYKRQGERKR